jgi:hypothetical protein
MRRLSLILVAALAVASPPPAMADKNSDAVIAGALIGALIAGAAANKNRNNNRYNYATDTVFFPPSMPGVMCYARARQCYDRGHYSTSATRKVFQ